MKNKSDEAQTDWYWRETHVGDRSVTLRCLRTGAAWGRCPHCESNKWQEVENRPVVTPVKRVWHSVVQYRCLKCGNEFLAEQVLRARATARDHRCARCGSRRFDKQLHEGAEYALWRCKKCHFLLLLQMPVRSPDDGNIGRST